MERNDIINILLNKINGKSYLEIGIANGLNFNSINCQLKIGVDPSLDTPATYHISSDEFFKSNTQKFDVIFIDGLHLEEQVYKDILNSLNCLNENGYIVCHDMNPSTEIMQLRVWEYGAWTGDSWKAFVTLRQTRNDLKMRVVDTDFGCGIITKGNQELINPIERNDLNYKNFEIHRKEWLNLISIKEFFNDL